MREQLLTIDSQRRAPSERHIVLNNLKHSLESRLDKLESKVDSGATALAPAAVQQDSAALADLSNQISSLQTDVRHISDNLVNPNQLYGAIKPFVDQSISNLASNESDARDSKEWLYIDQKYSAECRQLKESIEVVSGKVDEVEAAARVGFDTVSGKVEEVETAARTGFDTVTSKVAEIEAAARAEIAGLVQKVGENEQWMAQVRS